MSQSTLRFDLRRTLRWCVPLTALFIGITAMLFLHHVWLLRYYGMIESGALGQAEIDAEASRIDALGLYLGIAYTGLFVIAVIANGIWIYRASWNARELRPDEGGIRPGWAVGWFFVPIASLWMPFRAMRQTWNSSANPIGEIDRSGLGFLALWWWFWVLANIISTASKRMSRNLSDLDSYRTVVWMDMVSGVLLIGSGLLLIRLMREVTTMQETRLGDVFA